jgi:hypothetical protein
MPHVFTHATKATMFLMGLYNVFHPISEDDIGALYAKKDVIPIMAQELNNNSFDFSAYLISDIEDFAIYVEETINEFDYKDYLTSYYWNEAVMPDELKHYVFLTEFEEVLEGLRNYHSVLPAKSAAYKELAKELIRLEASHQHLIVCFNDLLKSLGGK